MTTPSPSENGSYRLQVALSDICVAPENLRFGQPADAGIPQLAETLAVDQIIDVICRPGKKGEAKFAALDGRRRLYAWQHLLEDGRIPADHPVWVTVETDPARQARAVVLTGTEREATHLADVIQCIGRLRSKKMTNGKIAEALGYSKLEIDRWAALASLPDTALNAMREGRLTLKQAKLLTKVKDTDNLSQIVEQAIAGSISDEALTRVTMGAELTVQDRRFRLVGPTAYAAAGGRTESDLFGDTPDVLLDPEILQNTWFERARPTAKALQDEGLQVLVALERQYRAPEGFAQLPIDSRSAHTTEEAEAFAAAERSVTDQRVFFHSVDELQDEDLQRVTDLVLAQLAAARALHTRSEVACAVLSPDHDFGIEVVFFAAPPQAQAAPTEPAGQDDAGQAKPSATNATPPQPSAPMLSPAPAEVTIPTVPMVTAKTNALHERYTDIATRGLIRAMADDPSAALTYLIARLFASVVLAGAGDAQASASSIQAVRYVRNGYDPIEALDGEVFDRLAVHRAAYRESGLRPIAWVESLAHGEKLTLLAELVAVTLNARESSATNPRVAARAEAAELAQLTSLDIRDYWTPDHDFWAAHSKPDLLAALTSMGSDHAEAAGLKKDDLAVFVTERAAEANWAPEALSFRQPADEASISEEAQADIADAA